MKEKSEILTLIRDKAFRLHRLAEQMIETPSKLELDLFNQQLRELYDLVDKWQFTLQREDRDSGISGKAFPVAEPVHDEEQLELKTHAVSSETEHPVILHTDTPVTETLAKEAADVEAETAQPDSTQVMDTPQPKPSIPVASENIMSVLSEKSIHPVPDSYPESVHDRISKGGRSTSVAEQLRSKSSGDLGKTIGLNERFKFINILFEGRQQLFDEQIEHLNRFRQYEEARMHLYENLAGRLQWDTESDAFLLLDDLVRRRFGA